MIRMLHVCSTVLLSGLNPACSSDSSSSALSLSIEDDFEDDLAWVTDQTNCSVILTFL